MMKVFELAYPLELQKELIPNSVSAIGFFDGIHLGHQKLLKEAIKISKEMNMESAIITFHPHPSVVLQKEKVNVKYLTTLEEKIEISKELGIDRLYIIEFNKELSQLSPQQFIDHFIIGLNIKHLVAGFDYTFGHKGSGNMGNIEQYTRGAFTYTTIDKVTLHDEKVSSTRIRKLIQEGQVDKANILLSRPYRLKGVVIKGDQRGRELGFPTANLRISPEALIPRKGIYAVKVIFQNEVLYGMANIGTNPTFTEDRQDLSVEINILDYKNDLYGQELIVEWYKYMRDEEKFASAEALIEQMNQDEINIRQFFGI